MNRLLSSRLASYLYASPRYLESFGEPAHPADLVNHECIGFKTTNANTWTLHNADDLVEVVVGGRFQLNSVGLIRRLAVLDLGIAVLPEEIADEVVDKGLLHRILPGWEGTPIPVYAMTETRLLPAKTQRFIDFLREHLGNGYSPSQG